MECLEGIHKLIAQKISRVYPFAFLRPTDVLHLLSLDDPFPSECVGVFVDGELKGAASFGVLPESSGSKDFNIIKPRDGVIRWFVCSDLPAGQALLRHCLGRLPGRVAAFPEFGDFRLLNAFNSGMLPVSFAEETTLFPANGFSIPSSDAWGPQERLCFTLDMPDEIPAQEFPERFTLAHETKGGMESSLRLEGAGHVLAGECRLSQCALFGAPLQEHVYVDWLWVDEAWRSHGFGGRLLLEQLRRARGEGAQTSLLTTHSGRPAHKLYRRLGYSEAAVMRTYEKGC